MLRSPLIFVLLVAIAVAGTDFQRRLGRRGFRFPALEGPLWVLIGFGAGEGALGLVPADAMAMLRAVVLVGLAWIGFVFGLQIDLSVLLRLQPWHRRIGILAPSAVGAGLAIVGLGLGLSPIVALGVAAVGMVSTPESIAAIQRLRRPTDRTAVRLIRLVAAFAGIPAVFLFAVATVVWGPVADPGGGTVAWWRLFAAMAGFGVISGYGALALVRGFNGHLRLLTIVAGVTTLIAGGSAVLGVSPLPTAVIAGSIVINRSVFPHRILRAAHSIERPLVIAMFILVGACTTGVGFSWAVFSVLSCVRLILVIITGRLWAARASVRGPAPVTPWIGFGLLPQGALALGITVALIGVDASSTGVLEAAIGAMIVNMVIGELWIRRFLFRRTPEGGTGR